MCCCSTAATGCCAMCCVPQDVECTRGLVAAGKVVGIEVLDHVVPGLRTPAHPQPWFSLRQGGLM